MRTQSIGQNITYMGKKSTLKKAQTITDSKFIESKINLLKTLKEDTCQFSQTDMSLNSSFLNDLLLNVAATNKSMMTKCLIVRDKLLGAMGYKHPVALNLVITKNEDDSEAAFIPLYGVIKIKDRVRSIEELISVIRHELEHLNQYVKLYKSIGKEKFLESYLIILKQKYPDITMSEIKANFNELFYEIMSEDADITNFDSKKYYDAMCEYPLPSKELSMHYKYYNNILEKDAYEVERKVLKALGKDPVVGADFFPANYETMIGLLKKSKFSQKKYDFLLYELKILAHIDNIENHKDAAKFFNIWMGMKAHRKVNSADEMWWATQLQNMLEKGREQTFESMQSEQERYQMIEEWLRQGKYTIMDVLKD